MRRNSLVQMKHLELSPRWLRRTAALLAAVALAGCKQSFSLPIGTSVRISIPGPDGVRTERVLSPDDPVIQNINNWFAVHQDGWEYGFFRRAAHIYLGSPGIGVNIRESDVTVKICRGRFRCDLWIQKDSSLFAGLRAELHLTPALQGGLAARQL